MAHAEYPRPAPSTPIGSDRGWGKGIVIYSALEILFCSCMVAMMLSSLHFGGSDLAKPAEAPDGPEEFVGIIMLVSGVVLLLGLGLSIIRLFGGRGVIKSRRQGFQLAAISSTIVTILTLPSLVMGYSILVWAPNLAFAIYGFGRLRGRWGPVPV